MDTNLIPITCGAPVPCHGLSLRLVLVEPQSILREGLKALIELQPNWIVVGAFGSAEDALGRLGELRPDLVLTELELSGMPGVCIVEAIQRRFPALIIVLTAHAEENYFRAALNAGADGYLLKQAGSAELATSIRTVSGGQQYVCKSMADRVLVRYLSPPGAPRSVESQSITAREREVLVAIANGNSNKQIARDLGVSPKTVEKHRSNLMRKLSLHNTASITMFAIRHGMAGSGLPDRRAVAPAMAFQRLAVGAYDHRYSRGRGTAAASVDV
jgi:two-component system response regulator NreC